MCVCAMLEKIFLALFANYFTVLGDFEHKPNEKTYNNLGHGPTKFIEEAGIESLSSI